MNSHQIGLTVFYHPWQQTTALLYLAELRMTSELQISSWILSHRAMSPGLNNLRSQFNLLFFFKNNKWSIAFLFFKSMHLIMQEACTSLRIILLNDVKYSTIPVQQCLNYWQALILLIPLLPHSDKSWFPMTTHSSISLHTPNMRCISHSNQIASVRLSQVIWIKRFGSYVDIIGALIWKPPLFLWITGSSGVRNSLFVPVILPHWPWMTAICWA